jgi:hypothetical protein
VAGLFVSLKLSHKLIRTTVPNTRRRDPRRRPRRPHAFLQPHSHWQYPSTSQRDPHRCFGCTYSLLWLRSQGQHFGRSRRYPLRHPPLFGLCPWPLVAPLATLKPTCRGLSPYMLTLLRKFSAGIYVVGGEFYFHVFPCTISFYSKPNAHSSNLRSHFVRRMLPHTLLSTRVDPCLRKGVCEIFRCSVVPILHKDWHRECSLFHLPRSVRAESGYV